MGSLTFNFALYSTVNDQKNYRCAVIFFQANEDLGGITKCQRFPN